ncbi:MAG TPA: hypothetical protein VE733_04690 [Streptosporangiaceae bacterium]|jgi:predicted O-methyltransferase YrrM|nr:hypothetical protein [Streptosporangiaceae bacterium]
MIHLPEGRKQVSKLIEALRAAEAEAIAEAARVRDEAEKHPMDMLLDCPEYRQILRLLHQVTKARKAAEAVA